MSRNFFKNKELRPEEGIPPRRRVLAAIALPIWVFLAFMAAQIAVSFALAGVMLTGVDVEAVNQVVLNTTLGAVIYAMTIVVVIGVPWLLFRQKTTRQHLGIDRWPKLSEIGLAPAGFLGYLFLSGVLLMVAQAVLPFIDYNQEQDIGFDGLSHQFEYILAFTTLVVVAPIAEEVLFRGYLFNKLRRYVPLVIAILITSLLFGLVHFQFNVGIDTFALSIVMCLLVVWTKSLWPAILLHMLKNFVAFYFLFINPTFLTTLGG